LSGSFVLCLSRSETPVVAGVASAGVFSIELGQLLLDRLQHGDLGRIDGQQLYSVPGARSERMKL
jgi:hypothetical protein